RDADAGVLYLSEWLYVLPNGLRGSALLGAVPDHPPVDVGSICPLTPLGLLRRGRQVSRHLSSPATQRQTRPVAQTVGATLLARQSIRRALSRVLTHLALLVVSITALIPLAFMVSTALKPFGQELIFPVRWIPQPAVWRNFVDAWTAVPTATF